MKQRLYAIAPLLAAVVFLGGCPSAPPRSDPPPSAADLDAMSERRSGAETRPLADQPLSPLDDPSSPLYRKVIYFDYDTVEIKPESADLLRTHAAYLYQTPAATVTLEGHTDERGTRDYNLALGERRADAVKRFMIAEGVAGERLTSLSYGEERPADPGHSESAWAKNRRVELVY